MSTLTGAKTTCKKKKAVRVILLDGEECNVFVDVKSKFQEVFNQVTAYLNLRETEYFGLAIKKDPDGEFHFLSLDEKIHKQAPRTWKSSQGEGFDIHGGPILTLHFRVQFYVDQVVLLREKVTRHLYYLQLKKNLLNYSHVCSEEKCFQMAAYALQADFGNYTPSAQGGSYFDPREYFPAWIVEKRGAKFLEDNAPLIHQDQLNLTKSEVEFRFIKEASQPPSSHNLHFYRLKKRKTDKVWNAWLGICVKGIEIFKEMDDGFKNPISTFLWPDIGKLYFEKKKFEIRSVGNLSRKFTYYTECDAKSKYLLWLCRSTHMFQMAIQPKLMEIRHLDAEDKRRYRESYIYSDTHDLAANGGSIRSNVSPGNKSSKSKQRYSMISDASSNTTSGIASDKMTVSFDDSDDHSREILIDCPPRQPTHLTPSQIRSNFKQLSVFPRENNNVSSLPNYRPSSSRSPKSLTSSKRSPATLNKRSPVLDGRPIQLYQSGGPRRSGYSQATAAAVQPDICTLSGSGSYRARLQLPLPQQQQLVLYNPIPTYTMQIPPVTTTLKEKSSRPASRSASRGDSFKNALSQLKVHSVSKSPSNSSLEQQSSDSCVLPVMPVNVLPPYPGHSHIDSGMNLGHVVPHQIPVNAALLQGFPNNMADSNTLSGAVYDQSVCTPSLSNVRKPVQLYDPTLTNNATPVPLYDENQTVQSSIMATIAQTVGLYNNNAPVGSSGNYSKSDEMKLQEAQEVFAPPPMFADGAAVTEIPVELIQSAKSHMILNLQGQVVNDPIPAVASEMTDNSNETCFENAFDDSAESKTEQVADVSDVPVSPSSNSQAQDSTLVNKAVGQKPAKSKVKLHPELQEICDQSHATSLPLMTALCNDLSLMHNRINSTNGSIAGSGYDVSTLMSTDSRISHGSREVEQRRLSDCYPNEMGTMVAITTASHRPFSWHSESFELDNSPAVVVDSHHSVPQNLSTYISPTHPTSSWTHAVAYSMAYRQNLDRYSPELIASQLMIPHKISSGGHSRTDDAISHKGLKENVGIA